jgi:hypothetical protein
MLKIKLITIFGVFVLVGIVLSNSSSYSTSAETDNALQEIANYKTWTKITKEPIKVGFQVDGKAGDENNFIVDGQEVINFRTGQLDG